MQGTPFLDVEVSTKIQCHFAPSKLYAFCASLAQKVILNVLFFSNIISAFAYLDNPLLAIWQK